MSETAARVRSSQSAHWYYPDGRPCFEVPYADASKGMRKTTLGDARKLGLIPSVTTILKVLHKQGLEEWKIEQACLAVLTAPRLVWETEDQFVHRVLSVEAQQDKEAQQAAELGSRIHEQIADSLRGTVWLNELSPYVDPAVADILKLGQPLVVEHVVRGDRYCGTADVICTVIDEFSDRQITIVPDIKTTKTLPTKDSWWEHQLQTAAYAKACGASRTANVYVSTTEPGKVVTFIQTDIEPAWQAFKHLLDYWYITNKL